MANDPVSSDLNQMFKDYFNAQRAEVGSRALATVGNVGLIAGGQAPRLTAQQFRYRQQGGPDPLQMAEARRRIIKDMGDYLAVVQNREASFLEKIQKQRQGMDGVYKLMQTYLTADTSGRSSVIGQKVGALQRITTDMSEAATKILGEPGGGASSAARNVYWRIREGLTGVDGSGLAFGPDDLTSMASEVLYNKQLGAKDQAMILSWLNAESADRFGSSLEEMMQQAAVGPNGEVGERSAYELLQMMQGLGPEIALAEQRLLAENAKIMQDGIERIQSQHGGVNMRKFAEFAEVAKGIFAGESANLIAADGALAGALPEADMAPVEEARAMLDELAGADDDRLNTQGDLREVKLRLMQSSEYQETVGRINEAYRAQYGDDWVDLDPQDNATFRFVNQLRKRQNKDRRKTSRDMIRLAKFGQMKEAPSKEALAASDGLGSEVELGTAGAEPLTAEEIVSTDPTMTADSVSKEERRGIVRRRQAQDKLEREGMQVPGAPTVTLGDVDGIISRAAQEQADASFDDSTFAVQQMAPGIVTKPDGSMSLAVFDTATGQWLEDHPQAEAYAAQLEELDDDAMGQAIDRMMGDYTKQLSQSAVAAANAPKPRAPEPPTAPAVNDRQKRIIELMKRQSTARNRANRRDQQDERA